MFDFNIDKNDVSLKDKKIVQIKKIREISRKTSAEIGMNFIVRTCSFNDSCLHSLDCNEPVCPYKTTQNFNYSNRQTESLKKRNKKSEIFYLFKSNAEFFEEHLINEKKILSDEELLNLIKITNYDYKNIFSYNYVKNEKNYNRNIIDTLKKSLAANQSKEANPKVVETYLQSYKNNNTFLLGQNFKNFEKLVLKEIIKNIEMPIDESKTLLLINKTLEALQKETIFSITGDKIIFDITFLSDVVNSFENYNLLEMLKEKNITSLHSYLKKSLFLSKLEIDKNEIKTHKKSYLSNDYYFLCNNIKDVEKYKNIIFDFLDSKSKYLNEEIMYSEFSKYSIQEKSKYVENELRNNLDSYYPKLKSESHVIKNFINQEMIKVLSNLKEFKLKQELQMSKELEDIKIKNKIRDISNEISL